MIKKCFVRLVATNPSRGRETSEVGRGVASKDEGSDVNKYSRAESNNVGVQPMPSGELVKCDSERVVTQKWTTEKIQTLLVVQGKEDHYLSWRPNVGRYQRYRSKPEVRGELRVKILEEGRHFIDPCMSMWSESLCCEVPRFPTAMKDCCPGYRPDLDP
ncbi:hypothetical protein NDU88_002249 [Pleurodeles waltl]|uniref:Uncharacterized protein n=1 Tax=Pleurodeles waltl TaxID=8319 RepID=A0AAV7VYU8_PLEWA|nr:hypothetical protein NDU88_002249 [Pleurodeles waltl]